MCPPKIDTCLEYVWTLKHGGGHANSELPEECGKCKKKKKRENKMGGRVPFPPKKKRWGEVGGGGGG